MIALAIRRQISPAQQQHITTDDCCLNKLKQQHSRYCRKKKTKPRRLTGQAKFERIREVLARKQRTKVAIAIATGELVRFKPLTDLDLIVELHNHQRTRVGDPGNPIQQLLSVTGPTISGHPREIPQPDSTFNHTTQHDGTRQAAISQLQNASETNRSKGLGSAAPGREIKPGLLHAKMASKVMLSPG